MLRYLKYTVITLFLLGMSYLAYISYDEYQQRQVLIAKQKQVEKETRAKSVPDLRLPSGDPVGSIPPMPPPPQREPKGGGAVVVEGAPDKLEAPVAKVKVAGVVEFEISEDNSWQTVFKILAIILGSVLGIRIINTGFNKLERQT